MQDKYSRRQMQRKSINESVLEAFIGSGGSKIEVIHTVQIDKNIILFAAISAAGVLAVNQLIKRF